ncbi:Response regulator receiver domain-containing protein [Salegentibacter holothuriorum]|uniref:Response regulator receiver domain-containing protein n=1 Tax=Salegentibacter holothuriorum TaxID=241145 RepID=A0A1T5EA59_9FLAO|nr:response regulator [Salegentibacter holothuriorum]SKB80731.1 Response regulator receiver domain-containing protein [Salegentibacter holothuriorum]
MTENYEWIFSGVGATVVGIALTYILIEKRKKKEKTTSKTATNTGGITINNNVNSPLIKESVKESPENKKNRIKESTRILFVDDNHTDFQIVSILKRQGWKNTKSIKDVINLDDSKVKESDIIFVDINGVGTTLFKDEGLGLASALKNKYADKKIIIYSADNKGDRFHKALREVDGCLSKDAEPFQFSNLIENLLND